MVQIKTVCTNDVFIIRTILVKVAKINNKVRTKLDKQFNKENCPDGCDKRKERNYPQTTNQPLSLLLNVIYQNRTNFMNRPINYLNKCDLKF